MLVAKLGEYISRTKSMKTREGNTPTRFDRSLKRPRSFFISVVVPPRFESFACNSTVAQTVTND